MCSTGSVPSSSGSGEVFFLFWPLSFSRNFLLFLCFIFVTGSCLIFGECMFGYGRTVAVVIGTLLFFLVQWL